MSGNPLDDLINLSKDDNFISEFSLPEIEEAKRVIQNTPQTADELLFFLCSVNLINAALKQPGYKALLHYGMIKPKIAKLFRESVQEHRKISGFDFYVNKEQQCAYVELHGLQFSFHHIAIDKTLDEFIQSEGNKVKSWKGIRLQRIAGELFRYSKTLAVT